MRTGRALMLIAMLAVQPICVFGRNVVFPPDPVGMKLYQAHHAPEMLALSIISCAFLLGWLIHAVKRMAKKLPPDYLGFYYI